MASEFNDISCRLDKRIGENEIMEIFPRPPLGLLRGGKRHYVLTTNVEGRAKELGVLSLIQLLQDSISAPVSTSLNCYQRWSELF